MWGWGGKSDAGGGGGGGGGSGIGGLSLSGSGGSGELGPGQQVTVNGRRLTVEKQIGEGGYSLVYKVVDASGTPYALKRMFAVYDDPDQVRRLQFEVDLLRTKKHANIVRVIDIQDSSRGAGSRGRGAAEVLILMEFCDGGSMADVINERIGTTRTLPESEVLKIFLQVCYAVAELHLSSPPIYHRDLKVENVLISRSGGQTIYKLCDFGSATSRALVPTKENRSTVEEEISRVTTPVYQSPEMVDLYRSQPIDDKSDIWALGCMLYKLAYLNIPFNEGERLGILNCKYRIPEELSSKFSPRIPDLIKRLLQSEPSDRPDISSLIDELEELLRLPRSNLPNVAKNYESAPKAVATTPSGSVFNELDWEDEPTSAKSSYSAPPVRASIPDDSPPSIRIQSKPPVKQHQQSQPQSQPQPQPQPPTKSLIDFLSDESPAPTSAPKIDDLLGSLSITQPTTPAVSTPPVGLLQPRPATFARSPSVILPPSPSLQPMAAQPQLVRPQLQPQPHFQPQVPAQPQQYFQPFQPQVQSQPLGQYAQFPGQPVMMMPTAVAPYGYATPLQPIQPKSPAQPPAAALGNLFDNDDRFS